VSFMLQLPVEKRTDFGAGRLSSSATLFVPQWYTVAQPPAFMSTTRSMAHEASSDVANDGSLTGHPIDLCSESIPVSVARQAADSTCTPSPCTGQEHSEAGTRQEDTAICVKNTFVVVDECEADGLQPMEMYASGAHTWAISEFRVNDGLKLERQPPMADQGTRTPSSDGSPSVFPDDPAFHLATPDASFVVSDCHGLRGHTCPLMAEAPLLLTSAALLGQSGQPGQANADSAPELSPVATRAGLVMVQVPLQVQWNTVTPLGCGPPNASVAVLSQNVDARTGAVSTNIRVVLSPPGTSLEGPSSTRMPQSRQQLRQSASSAALRRATAKPSAMAAEKRDSVCCHWKKKGWCRYKDECKFMHPTEQRGIEGEETAVGNADDAVEVTADSVVSDDVADAAAKLMAQPPQRMCRTRTHGRSGPRATTRLQAQ